MFSNRTRATLVIAAAILSLVAMTQRLWLVGVLAASAALFLAVGYWRDASVWLALRSLKAGDVKRTSRLLAQVRRPDRLSPQSRAYYEWLMGALAAGREQYDEAAERYRFALGLPLRTENDRAVVESDLAVLEARRANITGALELIRAAQARKVRPEVAAGLSDVAAAVDKASLTRGST